ncbi:MAG: DinB family protein [Ginsengibacter sp.]
MLIHKPTSGYDSFYQPYLDDVPNDGDLLAHLKEIILETEKLISGLSDEQLLYRYEKDKWTIKDILVHLSDCERIITYRAMRIARGDKTGLPGFDEGTFALAARANERDTKIILKELSALREASVVFIESLDEESLDRTGTANGFPMSARLLVNHLYGHHKHHLEMIRKKYLSSIGTM